MRRRQYALGKAIYDVREGSNVDVTAQHTSAGVFTPQETKPCHFHALLDEWLER